MTVVPLPLFGRGAWTKTGKLNNSVYYEYIAGKTLDGATTPLKDANWFGVNLGVRAIQKELNIMGWVPKLVEDGVFGSKTSLGVRWIQPWLGVPVDGRVGSLTSRLLWRREIKAHAAAVGVNPKYLYGTMMTESVGDSGAVGYTTPSDRGLFQINVIAHPDISPEQAHDTAFAARYRATRFLSCWNKFSGKGPELQEIYAIAEWNSPLSARTWYNSGVAPNEKIRDYVTKVKMYSSTW